MKKLRLDVEELAVDSFRTTRELDEVGTAMNTGRAPHTAV
jgi:hypothetical protein